MKNKSYQQYCGLAYALDIIGERWSLLLIREMVAGPRRFKDLLEGLPGISTNLLSDRLKNLEAQGVLRRRTLPPPAGSTVYELTERGMGLEKALLELGRWGAQFVPPNPAEDHVLHLGSYALTLKTFFRPEEAQDMDETYELRIGGEVLQVHIQDGDIDVRAGEAHRPTAAICTDVPTYLGLLMGAVQPQAAIAQGAVVVEGDPGALDKLLRVCGINPQTN